MEAHAEGGPSASTTHPAETSGKPPRKAADLLAGDSEIAHKPRILSLDGGGVRGLSSLVVLREIMEEVQRQAKLTETPRPCDYFDLIGGTSTGGLIAIMLGRLKMVLFQLSTLSRFNCEVNRGVHRTVYEVERRGFQS